MLTPPKKYIAQLCMFTGLSDQLNQHQPLYKLSHKINWSVFEEAFAVYYSPTQGKPSKPIRLIDPWVNDPPDDSSGTAVSVDTTVQERNITYPTDDKLYKKIIKKCWQIADKEEIDLRQSYSLVVKKLSHQQRFRYFLKNGRTRIRFTACMNPV